MRDTKNTSGERACHHNGYFSPLTPLDSPSPSSTPSLTSSPSPSPPKDEEGQPGCTCAEYNFTEALLEDIEQPTKFYHISAVKDYVIAAGEDNDLRVWRRQVIKPATLLFRLRMPPNILAITMSSNPLRIYVSTKDYVKGFTVEEKTKCTTISGPDEVSNVQKIRFQHDILILCSKKTVAGFRLVKGIWEPQFHFISTGILWCDCFIDALLVDKTKLVLLCGKYGFLTWRVYNYSEVLQTYCSTEKNVQKSVIFHRQHEWSPERKFWNFEVLDTSDKGLCLIASCKSDICVLNLVKEHDNPVIGYTANGAGDDNGGVGCFLRPCGMTHQPPFFFSDYNASWTIGQMVPVRTEFHKHGSHQGKYVEVASWRCQYRAGFSNRVFPHCYSYSLGVALIWDSLNGIASAVVLLDYSNSKGNCRLYKDYTECFYKLGKRYNNDKPLEPQPTEEDVTKFGDFCKAKVNSNAVNLCASDVECEESALIIGDNKSNSSAAKKLEFEDSILDLDAEDIDDHLMAPEYTYEIFNYLSWLETTTMPHPTYMDRQEDLEWNMRGILISWLIEVQIRFRLLLETLFLTVNILDRFLSSEVVHINRLQAIGIAAMFIASKIEEVLPPSVEDFSEISHGELTRDEICDAERDILLTLNYNLSYPGPMNFLRRISKADGYDKDTRTISKYLLEVTLLDHRFISYRPSQTAAASMYLARKIVGKGPWDATIAHYAGYAEEKVHPIFELMVTFLASPVIYDPLFIQYANKEFGNASRRSRKWAKEYVEFEEEARRLVAIQI